MAIDREAAIYIQRELLEREKRLLSGGKDDDAMEIEEQSARSMAQR